MLSSLNNSPNIARVSIALFPRFAQNFDGRKLYSVTLASLLSS
jgi:hypothetical protein